MLTFKDKLSIYKKLQLLQENYKSNIINFCDNFSNFEEIIKNFNKLNDMTLYEIKLFIDNLDLDEKSIESSSSTNNIFKNSFYKKDKTKIINLLSSIYKLFIINTSYINKENLLTDTSFKKTKKRKKTKQENNNEKNSEEYPSDTDSIIEYLIDSYKYDEVENNNLNSGFYDKDNKSDIENTENDTDTESNSLESDNSSIVSNEYYSDDNYSLYSFGSDVYNSINQDN